MFQEVINTINQIEVSLESVQACPDECEQLREGLADLREELSRQCSSSSLKQSMARLEGLTILFQSIHMGQSGLSSYSSISNSFRSQGSSLTLESIDECCTCYFGNGMKGDRWAAESSESSESNIDIELIRESRSPLSTKDATTNTSPLRRIPSISSRMRQLFVSRPPVAEGTE